MRMLTGLRAIVVIAVFAVLPAGAANAGQIATPMLFLGGGDQLVCIASNVSSQAIRVRVLIVGVAGNSAERCRLPKGNRDRNGCQASRSNDAGRCVISVEGLTDAEVAARLRGVMFTRLITSPFSILAVVEAR